RSSRHLARHSSDSLTQTWSGPIFLPRQPGDHGPGKWFQALLAVETLTHAFMAEDRLTLDASSSDLFMRWLVDSNFMPQVWSIRQAARHARSKTFARQPAPAV
ncbi:MAG: hypothetical protein AB7O62_13355, partial [Pirellulales bacterium]